MPGEILCGLCGLALVYERESHAEHPDSEFFFCPSNSCTVPSMQCDEQECRAHMDALAALQHKAPN